MAVVLWANNVGWLTLESQPVVVATPMELIARHGLFGPSDDSCLTQLPRLPCSGVNTNTPLYAAIVTPVVHYCMGGVAIDAKARALTSAGTPIPGLYAAGEVSGG